MTIAERSGGLDVLVRFTDLGHLPRLEQTIFALLRSTINAAGVGESSPIPLQVHVMLPRFSFPEVEAVRSALRPLNGLSEAVTLMLHNWDYPEPHDLGVPMLNLGLERTQGRYVSCLQIGDLLLPGAYERLLTRLQSSDAVMALGGLTEQSVEWWGDVILPVPAVHAEPQGDHSTRVVFVLDRTRVKQPDLVFHIAPLGEEIDVFVRRISEPYSVDLECASDRLGVRQILRSL